MICTAIYWFYEFLLLHPLRDQYTAYSYPHGPVLMLSILYKFFNAVLLEGFECLSKRCFRRKSIPPFKAPYAVKRPCHRPFLVCPFKVCLAWYVYRRWRIFDSNWTRNGARIRLLYATIAVLHWDLKIGRFSDTFYRVVYLRICGV